jgi:hypothetical protein
MVNVSEMMAIEALDGKRVACTFWFRFFKLHQGCRFAASAFLQKGAPPHFWLVSTPLT